MNPCLTWKGCWGAFVGNDRKCRDRCYFSCSYTKKVFEMGQRVQSAQKAKKSGDVKTWLAVGHIEGVEMSENVTDEAGGTKGEEQGNFTLVPFGEKGSFLLTSITSIYISSPNSICPSSTQSSHWNLPPHPLDIHICHHPLFSSIFHLPCRLLIAKKPFLRVHLLLASSFHPHPHLFVLTTFSPLSV